MNVTNNLAFTITATRDADNQQVMSNNISLPFDSNVAQGLISIPLVSGSNVLPLPQATCYQLYVRNTSQSNSITITITNTNGANQDVCTLYPNDVFILWQNPTAKNPNAGFSAVNLNGIGPNVFCEYFIGG